ncbi:MAG TPA: CoA ester lyase [Rhodobacteraceae bacterium]|nr:CoA ester lyase [Paracoccaceae bacterium]
MSSSFRPRRSVLYMPGANARALEKARSLAADGLILDLEDAVAPEAKALAREQVCAAVAAGGYGHREVIIRVNGPDTPWGADDLAAAIAAGPDAILLPKVSRPADLEGPAAAIAGAGKAISLWAMMETPLAVLNAGKIAAFGPPLAALVMGTNDLARETRARQTKDRLPMLAWLSTCIAAARAHGLDIIDGVYNDFRDEAGLAAECEQGRDLGMDGKTLIHPAQIGPCNAAFSPDDDEVARARAIIAAFEKPENRDKGVITLDGRMVERLHRDMARQLVAVAEAIERKETGS